jgi:hypothetical protein
MIAHMSAIKISNPKRLKFPIDCNLHPEDDSKTRGPRPKSQPPTLSDHYGGTGAQVARGYIGDGEQKLDAV